MVVAKGQREEEMSCSMGMEKFWRLVIQQYEYAEQY